MFIVAFPTTVYPNPVPPLFSAPPYRLATPPFFCSRIFFSFFPPRHPVCSFCYTHADTHRYTYTLVHPLIRSGWWSLSFCLYLSRIPPVSLSRSPFLFLSAPLSRPLSLAPQQCLSSSLCLSRRSSSRERCSTVFRISEMAREGWLTIFYCSNRPTNDPSREI